MSLSLERLKVASPPPTAGELEAFGGSAAIDAHVMVKAWSIFAAANVVVGNRVEITAGEQAGLIGKVLDKADEIIKFAPDSAPNMQIDIPVTAMRLYLRVGDYILVVAGGNIGKFGGVTSVERKADADIVTFTDDMSIKTGQPEEVSL